MNYLPRPLLFLFALFLALAAQAQPPSLLWNRAFGGTQNDGTNALLELPGGDLLVAGGYASYDGDFATPAAPIGFSCGYLMKMSANGTQKWIQKLCGNGSVNTVSGIAVAQDGNYFALLTSNSEEGSALAGMQNALRNNNLWLKKLDTSGTLLWETAFGGNQDDVASAVRATPDGGCIVVGTGNSFSHDFTGNHGDYDGLVVKLSASGSVEWRKVLGGSVADRLNSVLVNSDGTYTVVGTANSNNGDVSGQQGFGDAWIARLSATGTVLRSTLLGGNSSDSFNDVTSTGDGGFLAVGYTMSPNTGQVSGYHPNTGAGGFTYDGWAVRVSATGTLVWQKCLGGHKTEYLYKAALTGAGDFIVWGSAGSFDGDVTGNHNNNGAFDGWILRLSSSGSLVWQKCLGGSGADYFSTGAICSDGTLLFGGATESNDGDISGLHGTRSDAWFGRTSSIGLTSALTARPEAAPFALWPVPAQRTLWLEAESIRSVLLYGAQGARISALDGNGRNRMSIDVSALPPGLYFLELTDRTGRKRTQRFEKL